MLPYSNSLGQIHLIHWMTLIHILKLQQEWEDKYAHYANVRRKFVKRIIFFVALFKKIHNNNHLFAHIVWSVIANTINIYTNIWFQKIMIMIIIIMMHQQINREPCQQDPKQITLVNNKFVVCVFSADLGRIWCAESKNQFCSIRSSFLSLCPHVIFYILFTCTHVWSILEVGGVKCHVE